MRASGEMDDRFDAAQHFVPVGGGEIAQRDIGGTLGVLRGECAYDRDVRDAGFRKLCAERAANEAAGAGDQNLAAWR
jgi:hypothetical protein